MRTPGGLAIRFDHERGSFPQTLKRHRSEYITYATHRTTCIVSDAEGILVTQGVAYCSPADTFDREVGRQVSLFEAVKMLPKGSKHGAEMLQTYRSRLGSKPWRLDRHGHVLPPYSPGRTLRNLRRLMKFGEQRG